MKKFSILRWLDGLDYLCCLEEDKTMDGQRRFWYAYENHSRLQGALCMHYWVHDAVAKTRNARRRLTVRKVCGSNVAKACEFFNCYGKVYDGEYAMDKALLKLLRKGYDLVDQSAYTVIGDAIIIYDADENSLIYYKNKPLSKTIQKSGFTKEVVDYFGLSANDEERIRLTTEAKKVEPDICTQSEATIHNCNLWKNNYIAERNHLGNYREIYSGGFVFLYSTDWRNELSLVSFIKEETLNHKSRFEVTVNDPVV